MRILVLNAGSSSLKASVIDEEATTVARTAVDWGADATRAADRASGLQSALEQLAGLGAPVAAIAAVGHRVVHGGARLTRAAVLDGDTIGEIEAAAELAPLHNGVALETIRAARVLLPAVPHVAAFDTAFHATLPESALRYPLPERWRTDWGIRRYGFHGLSVAWSTGRASELLGRASASLGLVVAHLGSGCSVTAVDGGRSAWTSMGYTPLEGLMMGTRAGSIDPGILTGLLRSGRLDTPELADVLEHGSGLLAVAGTADMRELRVRVAAGDARATLAIEMFVERAAAGIAAAATALTRLDALVFTGGIGENDGATRGAICGRLGVLGIGEPAGRRTEAGPGPTDDPGAVAGSGVQPADAVVSVPGAVPAVLRIEAREDLTIAREAEAVLRP